MSAEQPRNTGQTAESIQNRKSSIGIVPPHLRGTVGQVAQELGLSFDRITPENDKTGLGKRLFGRSKRNSFIVEGEPGAVDAFNRILGAARSKASEALNGITEDTKEIGEQTKKQDSKSSTLKKMAAAGVFAFAAYKLIQVYREGRLPKGPDGRDFEE